MNTRHIIAAAALALTGVAASASPSVFTDMPSTASRAEVQAQVNQSRAEGRAFRSNDAYGAGDMTPYNGSATASVTTREEVLAELESARRSGEFDARGEVFGNFAWNQFGNIEQPLPEQAGIAAAEQAIAEESVMSAYQPQDASPAAGPVTSEPVVLWVPLDGEAITLQPGDAVLLVPSTGTVAPDAE